MRKSPLWAWTQGHAMLCGTGDVSCTCLNTGRTDGVYSLFSPCPASLLHPFWSLLPFLCVPGVWYLWKACTASLPRDLLGASEVIRARMARWHVPYPLPVILPLLAGQGSGRGWSSLCHIFWGSSFSASRGTQPNTGFIPCPFWSETGRAFDWFLISVKSLSAALMLFPWCYIHPINSPTCGFCALRPSEAEFSAFWQNPDQQTTLSGQGMGIWQEGKDQIQRLGRKLRLTLKTACVLNQVIWEPSNSSE